MFKVAKGEKAFTLLELMLVLAVFFLIGSISFPLAADYLKDLKFRSYSLKLYSIFLFTKSEAIKKREDIGLIFMDNRVYVFIDKDRDLSFSTDKGDEILKVFSFSDDISLIKGNQKTDKSISYVFDSRGLSRNGVAKNLLTFEVFGRSGSISVQFPSKINIL